MTLQDFSNEFDILFNNIASNQAAGLNEYEKSVFLTKAEYELTDAFFSPKNNKQMEGFDNSSVKEQMLVSLLVREDIPLKPAGEDGINPKAFIGEYPENIYAVQSESVTVEGRESVRKLPVFPLTVVEYEKMMNKVSNRPPKNLIWKIANNGAAIKECAEYLGSPNDVLKTSTIKYIKRPEPIILPDLDAGLSIDGYTVVESGATGKQVNSVDGYECKMHPSLHPLILQRAVELAKASLAGDLESTIKVGDASATPIAPMALAEMQAQTAYALRR